MGSVSTAKFCKHKTCPSAEMLLSYTRATLVCELQQQLRAHLDVCDFCEAELYLLSKFPPTGAPVYPTVKIPFALYRLAKDLLSVSTNAAGRAVEILCERERLSLTDA
ncbi:MAG TPA: hypothetical protein VEY11_18400 [Pyrinomonadaceae bacterium]|jgi:hypothetical protein|nr:hypothetical protein [Pyrinomonadaceae bacterium]